MSLTTARLRLTAVVAVVAFAAGASVARPFSDAQERPASPVSPVASDVGRGKPYVATHLFFGTGRHGGKPPIPEKEFLEFVADHITPRFPSGLTIQQGRGQWRDKEGDINRERSYELIVLYPAAEAHARDADIEYIRDTYTSTYDLESVLRSDTLTRADF
jgi:hypothetical protein